MAAFPYPRHTPSKPVAKIVDGNKVGGNSDMARYEVQINHKGLCPSSCLTSSAEAALPSTPRELTHFYALMPSLSIQRPQ
ncbi:hypothetical protein G5I_07177 [Acromyrmex echinatior]|uniref:Uncharacterized protein n=1 Tax=Acromyrmex echinatior TaxID=103372 RepID=F4WN30_ACREC|nr:hypothetical protein G5I_07177 [Acromyrmex echinatior]